MILENTQNKENSSSKGHEQASSFQTAISTLQEELAALREQCAASDRQHISVTEALRAEVEGYKRKLSQLSEKYVVSSILKQKDITQNSTQYSTQYSTENLKNRQRELIVEELKAEIEVQKEQNIRLRKDIQALKRESQTTKQQKDKNMEISLLEKIQLEDRMKLLEQEIRSKTNIAQSLKRQLDRVHGSNADTALKQRRIVQKGKELETYGREMEETAKNAESKFNQKISQLKKENAFLKERIRQFQQFVESKCKCEFNDDAIRDHLYEIKRELAVAKIEIGRSAFIQQHSKGAKWSKKKSGSSSDSHSDK